MAGNVRTTLTTDSRYDSKTGRNLEGGDLSLEARYPLLDNGASLSVSGFGGYLHNLENDSYRLRADTLFLGLNADHVALKAGLVEGGQLFGIARRFLGGNAALWFEPFSVSVYGGRESLTDIWGNELPTQELGNTVAGATVRVGGQEKYLSLNYEHEFAKDDNDVDGRSVSLLGNYRLPWWKKATRIFTGGQYLFSEVQDIRDSYDWNSGLGIRFLEGALEMQLSHRTFNQLPIFRTFTSERRTDQRGRLAMNAAPLDGLRIDASAEAGERSEGGGLGIDTRYLGAYALLNRDRSGPSPRHSIAATGYGRLPVRDNLELGPYAAVVYTDEDAISDLAGGVRTTGGAQFTWRPWSWLGFIARGGVENSPLTGTGGSATLNVVIGGGGDGSTRVRGGRRSISQRVAGLVSPVVKRFYGALMAEATKFGHKMHIEDASATCTDCHSQNGLITVKDEKLDGDCSGCHDGENAPAKEVIKEKLERLSKVVHPGSASAECSYCHEPIKAIASPTGGMGQIISYPHSGESRRVGSTVWDHPSRAGDPACKPCHSGNAQFEDHLVESCNECHARRSPHPDEWRGAIHTVAGKEPTSCKACHTELNSCRSCHTEEDVLPRGLHPNDFMRKVDGEMGHGVALKGSDGQSCVICHGPAESFCKSCHN